MSTLCPFLNLKSMLLRGKLSLGGRPPCIGTTLSAPLNWQIIFRKLGYCLDRPSTEKCFEKSTAWLCFARFAGLPTSERAALAIF